MSAGHPLSFSRVDRCRCLVLSTRDSLRITGVSVCLGGPLIFAEASKEILPRSGHILRRVVSNCSGSGVSRKGPPQFGSSQHFRNAKTIGCNISWLYQPAGHAVFNQFPQISNVRDDRHCSGHHRLGQRNRKPLRTRCQKKHLGGAKRFLDLSTCPRKCNVRLIPNAIARARVDSRRGPSPANTHRTSLCVLATSATTSTKRSGCLSGTNRPKNMRSVVANVVRCHESLGADTARNDGNLCSSAGTLQVVLRPFSPDHYAIEQFAQGSRGSLKRLLPAKRHV